jgi:hypothetical protein
MLNIENSLAEQGEFELTVPICQQSDEQHQVNLCRHQNKPRDVRGPQLVLRRVQAPRMLMLRKICRGIALCLLP